MRKSIEYLGVIEGCGLLDLVLLAKNSLGAIIEALCLESKKDLIGLW